MSRTKCFGSDFSFYLRNNPMKKIFICSFYRWGNFAKVTELVNQNLNLCSLILEPECLNSMLYLLYRLIFFILNTFSTDLTAFISGITFLFLSKVAPNLGQWSPWI